MPKAALILVAAIVVCGLSFSVYQTFANQSAAPSGSHSVTLKWTPSTSATSYNVFRSEVRGGPYKKIGSSATSSYMDTPVPGGAIFYYVVTSISSHGESSYSEEIKIIVPK